MFTPRLMLAALFSVISLAYAAQTQAKPIYKCQVNGTVQFSEEACGADAKPVELKGIAAPLKPIDMEKLKAFEASERVRILQSRIDLRQKRVGQYRIRMNKEIKALEKKFEAEQDNRPKKNTLKNSVREKDIGTQVRRISDNTELTTKGTLSEQINSVVIHYKTLIKAEEVQIGVLLQQLLVEQRRQ